MNIYNYRKHYFCLFWKKDVHKLCMIILLKIHDIPFCQHTVRRTLYSFAFCILRLVIFPVFEK